MRQHFLCVPIWASRAAWPKFLSRRLFVTWQNQPRSPYKIYYYKREDSTREQDFFVRTASSLIPIEVKAKNGTAKSIRTLIASEKYDDIHCGIKLTDGNIGFNDNIYTFPYFCTFLLKRYFAKTDL